MITGLPVGFRVTLDPSTKELDSDTLFGGSPPRLLRLSDTGRAAWAELRGGPVATPAAGVLARRLTDAGLAHPDPPASTRTLAPEAVTVIVPVRDRCDLLERCLSALAGPHRVIVVDDGSCDPVAVAEIGARHGAGVVRRDVSGGPGAARNSGLAAGGLAAGGLAGAGTEIVAFVDSDCVAPPGWITALAAHFADPCVGAVAPRIVAVAATSSAGRYSRTNSALDLGAQPARVAPRTRIAYVPGAALLVRRQALVEIAVGTDVFTPGLRYGEDVDLVWRLHAAGWRVRYDPTVHVAHHEPSGWPALLARRFRYGTSAAPLARRHPGALAPLVLQPGPALTVAALLARRPLLAGVGFAASVLALSRAVRRVGLPGTGVVPATAKATYQTWLGAGRYLTQFAAPLLGAAIVAGGRRRWGRRAAAASLLLGPPVASWTARRPGLALPRYAAANVADDIAYGAGVWRGALAHRTAAPLVPTISWPALTARASQPAKGKSQ